MVQSHTETASTPSSQDAEARAWAVGWRVAILDGRRRFVREPRADELNKFDPLSGKIIAYARFPDWEALCNEYDL